MWNKAKCILLETKENSGLLLGLSKFGRLISYDTECTNPNNDIYSVKQHLYIINDDIIKVNDWYLATDKIEHCSSKEEANDLTSNCKKIIATTNKSLQIKSNHLVKDRYALLESLPQIPQSFIEQYITEYNKGNIINEVLVEYIQLNTDYRSDWKEKFHLKTNQSNEINIKTVKDSFSREEVKQLLYSFRDDVEDQQCSDKRIDKFIEQNL